MFESLSFNIDVNLRSFRLGKLTNGQIVDPIRADSQWNPVSCRSGELMFAWWIS